MAYQAWSVVFGEQPSASKWNLLGSNDAHFYSFLGDNLAWQSWTPTWGNLTVSSSTVTAKYIQIGKIVHFRIAVVLAGGNAPSGAVTFSLPVTAVDQAGTDAFQPIGSVGFLDAGNAEYSGIVMFESTTAGRLYVINTASTYAVLNNISATVPFSFGNTDEILMSGTYEAA